MKIKMTCIILASFLAGCNSGSSSSPDGSTQQPIPNNQRDGFANIDISDVVTLPVDGKQSVMINVSESENNQDLVAYFEWQRKDGVDIPEGAIRPVKGIIHLSPFDDHLRFNLSYRPGIAGDYIVVVRSETARIIENSVTIRVQ